MSATAVFAACEDRRRIRSIVADSARWTTPSKSELDFVTRALFTDNRIMPTPYAEHVGDWDPVDVLRTSLDEYRLLLPRISADAWRRPWAPGKWTIAQVVLHVAQWEIILGVRLRCAVALPNYTVQPMDQDPFVDVESKAVDGPTAAAGFLGVRQMNLALAASLTPEQRQIVVLHPERGPIDVNDLMVTLAGHAVHHLKQLHQAIGR
jgi:hypothetical protein